jgi:hypothetical protein
MPSRAKNSTIGEVTDLPMTSQLNGWLEVRRTRFLFQIVEQKLLADISISTRYTEQEGSDS